MIDLSRAIKELYEERDRLAAVIAHLEELNGSDTTTTPAVRSRRGRKSMGEIERREVSARMKRYWAKRRRMKAAV